MSASYIPQRALFIYAHPDDIEFSAAGTAAYWAANGCRVHYVLITDGNGGSHDLEMTPERLAEIRRAEQREAAAIVGATVTFLGYADGVLQPTLQLRRDLVREIRRHRPNVVMTGDPAVFFNRTNNYINHPDHRAAATATLDAVYPAPNSPLIFPELLAEGFEPCEVNYVYISNPGDAANIWIDITQTLDKKIAALKAHPSQMRGWDPTERIKAWSGEIGKQVGLAHAEIFRRITLKEDQPEAAAASQAAEEPAAGEEAAVSEAAAVADAAAAD